MVIFVSYSLTKGSFIVYAAPLLLLCDRICWIRMMTSFKRLEFSPASTSTCTCANIGGHLLVCLQSIGSAPFKKGWWFYQYCTAVDQHSWWCRCLECRCNITVSGQDDVEEHRENLAWPVCTVCISFAKVNIFVMRASSRIQVEKLSFTVTVIMVMISASSARPSRLTPPPICTVCRILSIRFAIIGVPKPFQVGGLRCTVRVGMWSTEPCWQWRSEKKPRNPSPCPMPLDVFWLLGVTWQSKQSVIDFNPDSPSKDCRLVLYGFDSRRR